MGIFQLPFAWKHSVSCANCGLVVTKLPMCCAMQPRAFLGASYSGVDDDAQQPSGCVAACAHPALLLQGHASTIYMQEAAGERPDASLWCSAMM